MRLEEVAVGQRLHGVCRGVATVVVAVSWQGSDAISLIVTHDRGAEVVLLTRADEPRLVVADGVTRAFDAPAADYRLALEARRIAMAGRFDPMLAVSTSDVRPLPHQLRAVYGEMLEQTPLRFLLADDPGAGKTIMAGLYLKELKLRGDASRCLIVAPGGLVEQWQEELRFKFDLRFEIFSGQLANDSLDANVFDAHPWLICRMDQLARNDVLMDQLSRTHWDVAIVDEAHRMSASWFGDELKRTKRFLLGELLGRTARHLLLMTATPHTGIEADFQQFLTLLDKERFEGRYRDGMRKPDTSGLMRRMVKEELLTFDGKPLFPDRVAETVPFELSALEAELYEAVSGYVRDEMNRAAALDGQRRNTIGFALTVLQRRLASSPEAIYRSLERRLERLQHRRRTVSERVNQVRDDYLAVDVDLLDDDEEYLAEEIERAESELADAASASQTVEEVDHEIAVVRGLLALASRVRASQQDCKWNELRTIVDEQVLATSEGGHRKLIVFTEHRDTLSYLEQRVRTQLGRAEAVVSIHGGVGRDERRRITSEFTTNPDCWVMIATDAAGEGLNLQAAHLMVNYDLPWNPNRIDQRFGRIHRIGQLHECRLWNLVAVGTREGDVYRRLLDKLAVQAKAYKGKVFEVLGEGFRDRPLRELLMEAILHGDDPQVRARMEQVIDETVSVGLPGLMAERALARETLGPLELQQLREQFDEAASRRLQPYYIELFFMTAFKRLGGRIGRREGRRFEISQVPARLRSDPHRAVSTRYERVTFEIEQIQPDPGATRAELLAPGHVLFDRVVEATLGDLSGALERGATFVGDVAAPQVLVATELAIRDDTGEPLDEQFSFAFVSPQDGWTPAGPGPHLDLVAADADPRRDELCSAGWVRAVDDDAVAWVADHDLRDALAEIVPRREAEIDRVTALVAERLGGEINRLYTASLAALQRQENQRAVKQSADALRRRAEELQVRQADRLAELADQRRVRAATPRVLTAALVLPVAAGSPQPPPTRQTEEVERRAVDAVLATERALGREPVEQARNNKGFDIVSRFVDGSVLFIEVKGRIEGAEDFSVTVNEVLFGKQNAGRHVLALVRVDPRGAQFDEVRYLRDAFAGVELAGMENSRVVNFWDPTWAKGMEPS